MDFAKCVKTRDEKFGSVIFDTLREKVFVTNKTGSDILGLIKENRTQNDIIDILKQKHSDSENNIITADTSGFIGALKKQNILV